MKTLLKILLLTDIFNAMLWRLYLHTILTELNCHTLLVCGPITFILLTSSPSSLISCCSLINFCCGDSIFIPSSPTYRKIWICVLHTYLLTHFYKALFFLFFFQHFQLSARFCICLKSIKNVSCDARKPVFWFPTSSNTNRPVQSQKKARSLKFRI